MAGPGFETGATERALIVLNDAVQLSSSENNCTSLLGDHGSLRCDGMPARGHVAPYHESHHRSRNDYFREFGIHLLRSVLSILNGTATLTMISNTSQLPDWLRVVLDSQRDSV